MTHILTLYAAHAAGPGPFEIFGWKAPAQLGEALHWVAHSAFPWAIKSFRLLASLFIILLMIRRGGSIWQLAFAVILGWVVFPGLSPKVSHVTANLTNGSAVGHTGASIGMLALLVGMIVFILILLPILRARSQADSPGGEG